MPIPCHSHRRVTNVSRRRRSRRRDVPGNYGERCRPGADQVGMALRASWFETRGVAALLTMRVSGLILRNALLRASRRMKPPNAPALLQPGIAAGALLGEVHLAHRD